MASMLEEMPNIQIFDEMELNFFCFYFIQDVTADEFQICMNLLASTKLGTTSKGQSELVALAIEQAELNSEEEPIMIEDEHVERYILCATHCLPYFSVRLHLIFYNTKFRIPFCLGENLNH